MQNFTYCNPVKIVFGKGTIAKLNEFIGPKAKILLTYGGGSIKKNGVYRQVKAALKKRKVVEFGGIEPNPSYETCIKAVQLGHREKVDFILAVGGGSVLDGSKFIAAAIKHTIEFFNSIDMPTSLKDYNITRKDTEKVVNRFAQRGSAFGENRDIDAKAVEKILKLCL